MKCLNVLFEDEGIQNFLQENEGSVVQAANMFAKFPQDVKTHILENIEVFLDEDVKKTYTNMREFAESAAFNFLHELSSAVADGELNVEEATE
jgi:hypothetical protein